MAYHSDDSCFGCLFDMLGYAYIILIIFFFLGLIRECAFGSNGSSFLSGCSCAHNSGSKSVSGGTGTIGTTNGANIQYPVTTEPNYDSSPNDYSSDEMPLEPYPENEKSVTNIQESSSSGTLDESPGTISVPILDGQNKKHTVTCPFCDGTGVRTIDYYYFSDSPFTCAECGRVDTHTHSYEESCISCAGTGKIEEIEWPEPNFPEPNPNFPEPNPNF